MIFQNIFTHKLFKMSAIKQVTIHQFSANFGLPREMAHEILGFCFYDTETALYRAVHKSNMAEVVDHFDNAYISRAKPEMSFSSDFILDPDNCESWAVYLVKDSQEYDDEVQFQASNCRTCGNYKLCNTHIPTDEQLEDYDPHTGDAFWRIAIPICMRCSCN